MLPRAFGQAAILHSMRRPFSSHVPDRAHCCVGLGLRTVPLQGPTCAGQSIVACDVRPPNGLELRAASPKGIRTASRSIPVGPRACEGQLPGGSGSLLSLCRNGGQDRFQLSARQPGQLRNWGSQRLASSDAPGRMTARPGAIGPLLRGAARCLIGRLMVPLHSESTAPVRPASPSRDAVGSAL